MGTTINIVVGLVLLVLILGIVRTSVSLLFDVQEQSASKIRLRQLQNMKVKENVEFKEIMDLIAQKGDSILMPRLKQLFPSIGKVDKEKLQRDLTLADWADTFTPESFISCVWTLRVVGILVFPFSLLFLEAELQIIGIAVGVACFMGLEWWLKSSVQSVQDELFAEFPDFIRIVSGYLSADIPLVQSITDSIKYVGDAWEPILKTFVIDCENKSVDTALENMKNTVDLFDVKEFISLIKLTLEQGGKAKDGFLEQADKIEELQRNQLVLKVGKRKMLGTVAQAPLLLINMVIIALPTLASASEMFAIM